MDYEREDKYALCRATLAEAKADAIADGGTHVRTAGGLVPILELFASFDGVPIARGGWIYTRASDTRRVAYGIANLEDEYTLTRPRRMPML